MYLRFEWKKPGVRAQSCAVRGFVGSQRATPCERPSCCMPKFARCACGLGLCRAFSKYARWIVRAQTLHVWKICFFIHHTQHDTARHTKPQPPPHTAHHNNNNSNNSNNNNISHHITPQHTQTTEHMRTHTHTFFYNPHASPRFQTKLLL